MTAWKKVSLCVVCLQLAWVGCGNDGDKVASLVADPPDSSMESAGEDGAMAAGSKGGGKKGTAGQGSTEDPGKPVVDPNGPDEGATEFVSADPAAANGSAQGVPGRGTPVTTPGGASTGSAGSAAASPTAPPAAMQPESAADGFKDAGGAIRSVERGDIYRVLGDQRILNLNGYRGLQIIDISDVDAPRIEGRFAVAGTPVEMYVIDQRAIVLLNDWQGYYGSRDDVQVEGVNGGLVLNIDISDRAAPKLLSQAIVSGYISTSRLTTGTGQSALYVAASVNQNEPPYGSTTLVKSFDVSGDKLTPKSEIDLGGSVQDVQATTDLLLVSSVDYNNMTGEQRSVVSLVDISRPDGTMQRGGSVTARGFVQNKFNMDAYNGVLRVVSGSNWNGTQQNTLETFSLDDLANPRPLDECAFGQTEQLYATIFIEDRAFFVTYFRTDPLHAFSIDARGRCAEHNAFVVSGWNDFLRPTLDGTRMIGVGMNDENNRRTVSVSLYDTVDVDNPNPLLSRADLALDNSYSEAQWDDRAFSVIEDAVSVRSSNDVVETGLVLVPFQGYNATTGEQVAQVQVLTFSDRTLTRRGVMDHGTPVRRSFLADDSTAANLSEQELRLFDLTNPSLPVSEGRVDVAPNYRQLLVYGEHVARVHDASYYYGYYPAMTPPSAQVEIVGRKSDLDSAAPVAEFEVPATATLTKVGNLLVSTLMTAIPPDANTKTDQVEYMTSIQVYDLSDPAHPQRRGSLETDRLQPNYGYGYPYPYPTKMGGFGGAAPPGIVDCFDCWGGPTVPSLYVVGDTIVYQSGTQQQKSLGFVESCYEYPSGGCEIDPRTQNCTTYLSGQITCTTYRGKPEMCSGEFVECPAEGGECKPVDPDTIPTQKQCSSYEDFRYWQAYNFDALDLRDANAPVLADRLEMERNEEGTSVIISDGSLYYNFQTPHTKQDDPRSYVKRFFRELDFADPRSAKLGPAINVPGDVIAAADPIVFTRDFVYDEADVRTMVARLEVDGKVARLRASRVFSERTVDNVKLDGAGHMLVSNGPAYGYAAPVVMPTMKPEEQPQHRLTILSDETLDVSGEVDIDDWATFTDAKAGRALFAVSGGLLVVSVEDPEKPHAQAFFRTVAWPSDVYFDGQEAMFAGGPYGIYRFDTDVFNLLMK